MRPAVKHCGFMQEEDRMGRFGATAVLILAGALPAVAAELPTRKAGLWEVKMSFENRNGAGQAIAQCIDAATSHAVITGSFDSAYTMTVTSESDALPGGKMTMTIAAKWLGPCTADQKPGDMIMGNGFKMNILEMQKRGLSQGVPLPP